MRILIVEDERRVAENIASVLREGPQYTVDCVEDGESGLSLTQRRPYDVIVLDLMLPRMRGIDLLHNLRSAKSRVPVLILTANNEKTSVVQLLEAGADDYLGKPFDLGELIARIKVLGRRGKDLKRSPIHVGAIELDTVRKSAKRNGRSIPLSPTEYRLLEFFFHRMGHAVTREELLEYLYDYNWKRHTNVLEAHISNLRRKIEQEGASPLIETLRGQGYRMRKIDAVRA